MPPNRVMSVSPLGVVAHRVLPLAVRLLFRAVLYKITAKSDGLPEKSAGLMAAAFGHVAL